MDTEKVDQLVIPPEDSTKVHSFAYFRHNCV